MNPLQTVHLHHPTAQYATYNMQVRPAHPMFDASSTYYVQYNPQAEAYPPYGDGFSLSAYVQVPTSVKDSHRPSPLHTSSAAPPTTDINTSLYSPTGSTGYITPPSSTESSFSPTQNLEPEEDSTVVAISTAFHPQAHPHLPPTDIVFSASDAVLFYAHSSTILAACPHAFSTYIGGNLNDPKFRDQLIQLDAPSQELNVILHMLYGTSSAAHSPLLETLINAVDRMPSYSIVPEEHIVPSSHLHILLLSYAPLHPLELYTLAACHNLNSLAIKTSSHLLSYSLQTITDEQAERIGAVYLKKLMVLHFGRFTALRNILLQPPHPHPPTRECDFSQQRKLTRAWALVSAYLAWDARPGILPIGLVYLSSLIFEQTSQLTRCKQRLIR
ncbi:hypothetical protein NLJ89_g7551 [Agrocybe chaxingu]|uniref:BTB domain-containing protein n=1 Tax=Agrocybe chaxingu TaxID=84603 RepID=A0A9W8MTK5_9AGAR|nr:hypothetical protein NLJ89_g7551 [Agrocybe chaxingu]